MDDTTADSAAGTATAASEAAPPQDRESRFAACLAKLEELKTVKARREVMEERVFLEFLRVNRGRLNEFPLLETEQQSLMIAQMVSKQASEGLGNVVALAALISVNLGVLNLLPIPVLDGGHLLFYLVEICMRRPVSPRLRQLTTRLGLAFLLALMILATVNDIRRQLSVFDG